MLAFLSAFLLSAPPAFLFKEIRLIMVLIYWLLALPWPSQPSGTPMDFWLVHSCSSMGRPC
jgi:hypothetical protein